MSSNVNLGERDSLLTRQDSQVSHKPVKIDIVLKLLENKTLQVIAHIAQEYGIEQRKVTKDQVIYYKNDKNDLITLSEQALKLKFNNAYKKSWGGLKPSLFRQPREDKAQTPE